MKLVLCRRVFLLINSGNYKLGVYLYVLIIREPYLGLLIYRPQFAVDVITTEHLRQKLLEYVGDGDANSVSHMQDAEVGQRIFTAMQMVENLARIFIKVAYF